MKHSSLRRLVGTGLTAAMLGVSAVAVAAPAGAANSDTAPDGARRHRMHLTDDQKQCLKDEGISRPIRPLTREKVGALQAAAKACDITLPNRLGERLARRLNRVALTDDQKQCLKDEGISRPIRPLTREKVAALKAAAEACDITRPNHGGDRKSARPS